MKRIRLIETAIKCLKIPKSQLDKIIEEGFVPISEDFGPHGYDLELYAKGEQRIIYDGKIDKIITRYEKNPKS